MFEVRLLPHPLPSPRAEICSSTAAAVRQPGYLLQASSRGLLGSAPPLRSRIAFIATPERQRLCERSYQLGGLQSIRRIYLPRAPVNKGDRGRVEGGLCRATPTIESALLLSP